MAEDQLPGGPLPELLVFTILLCGAVTVTVLALVDLFLMLNGG